MTTPKQLRAINKALAQANGDEKKFVKQIDTLIRKGELVIPGEAPIVQKAAGKSKLDIRNTDTDYGVSSIYAAMRNVSSRVKDLPNFEDPYVDYYLADVWKTEPILAGAVYSMAAKMTAISWSVTGRKLAAKKVAQMLASAAHMGGNDWAGFISSTAQDFYTTNRGVFWETPRNGHHMLGALADIGHIDSLSCSLTGNSKYPVYYESELTGQALKFRDGETIHFASMPSPRERHIGMGFCAVARSIRAAKLLIGLHDYDAEKLDNLPPEGVAAVTGLTLDEFNDAIALWMADRKKNNSLTFPQVLWLIGSQPTTTVSVDFIGFSQMPESFERKIVVEQYVNLIALVFGVDAREFWPISTSSLGTAAESEIQHMKAKGKGPGEFISITERHINGELPDDVDFAYDTQDIEEDLKSAEVANAWISAYMPLLGQAAPQAPQVGAGENGKAPVQQPQQAPSGGLLEKDQVLRLLVDKGVLPDYLLSDGKTSILDVDVHIDKQLSDYTDDFVKIKLAKDGRLMLDRLYIGEIYSGGYAPVQFMKPALPAQVVQKSQDEAPRYRRVEKTAQKRCTNCAYSRGLYCEKYDFHFEPGHVCDAWEATTTVEKQFEHEDDAIRNIIGNPIPEKESLRGASPTRRTVIEENELWKKTPGLAEHAMTDEEARNYKVS